MSAILPTQYGSTLEFQGYEIEGIEGFEGWAPQPLVPQPHLNFQNMGTFAEVAQMPAPYVHFESQQMAYEPFTTMDQIHLDLPSTCQGPPASNFIPNQSVQQEAVLYNAGMMSDRLAPDPFVAQYFQPEQIQQNELARFQRMEQARFRPAQNERFNHGYLGDTIQQWRIEMTHQQHLEEQRHQTQIDERSHRVFFEPQRAQARQLAMNGLEQGHSGPQKYPAIQHYPVSMTPLATEGYVMQSTPKTSKERAGVEEKSATPLESESVPTMSERVAKRSTKRGGNMKPRLPGRDDTVLDVTGDKEESHQTLHIVPQNQLGVVKDSQSSPATVLELAEARSEASTQQDTAVEQIYRHNDQRADFIETSVIEADSTRSGEQAQSTTAEDISEQAVVEQRSSYRQARSIHRGQRHRRAWKKTLWELGPVAFARINQALRQACQARGLKTTHWEMTLPVAADIENDSDYLQFKATRGCYGCDLATEHAKAEKEAAAAALRLTERIRSKTTRPTNGEFSYPIPLSRELVLVRSDFPA